MLQPDLPASELSFDAVRGLKHVVVAHRVPEEPEVLLWHADIMAEHPDSQTFDVRIREWTRLVRNVSPSAIFKPRASLPAV